MTVTERRALFCSFCGKEQSEVKKLIAGPTVFICDECTILCLDILVEESIQRAEVLSREQQMLRREKRVAELIKLFEAILEVEEERNRPYVLLKKKVHEFSFLYGLPIKEASTQE